MKLLFNNYRVVYRIERSRILTVAVIHGARDWSRSEVEPWRITWLRPIEYCVPISPKLGRVVPEVASPSIRELLFDNCRVVYHIER